MFGPQTTSWSRPLAVTPVHLERRTVRKNVRAVSLSTQCALVEASKSLEQVYDKSSVKSIPKRIEQTFDRESEEAG